MSAQRRPVIRTAAVAIGALAALLVPVGAASAAGFPAHVGDRTSMMLPDDGLAGLAERAGQLPTGGLVGGAGAVAAAGVGLALHRRRQGRAAVSAVGRRATLRAQRGGRRAQQV